MCASWISRVATACLLALLAVAVFQDPAAAQTDDAVTTVVLVRHSERRGQGRDPSLSAAGKARARAIAHVLGEVKVHTIYATQFARTQQTAQPLADRLGLPVTVVDAAAGYAKQMARLIRTEHRGDVVVVVSHSNTVPAIIAAFGATPVPVIDEDEYDDLYVVTLSDAGANVLNFRYGARSP